MNNFSELARRAYHRPEFARHVYHRPESGLDFFRDHFNPHALHNISPFGPERHLGERKKEKKIRKRVGQRSKKISSQLSLLLTLEWSWFHNAHIEDFLPCLLALAPFERGLKTFEEYEERKHNDNKKKKKQKNNNNNIQLHAFSSCSLCRDIRIHLHHHLPHNHADRPHPDSCLDQKVKHHN
jgi:hypothetical protein